MATPTGPKLISCRVCGMIMVRFSKDVCPKCFAREEELFQKVKEYLKLNPGVTIKEVARAVMATEVQVEFFVNSGRLERIGAQIAHTCQTCNKTIKIGLICPECSKELKEKVSNLQREIKDHRESEGGGKGEWKPRKMDS